MSSKMFAFRPSKSKRSLKKGDSLPAIKKPAVIFEVTGVSCSRKAKTVANTDEQPRPIRPVPNQRAKIERY